MSLTKDQILSAPPRLAEIQIPEWGGSIFIRPITLAEQAKLADLGNKFEKGPALERLKNTTLTLVSWVACDDAGNRLFENGDIAALLNKPAGPVLRIQEEILKISGLTKESREELEKNLLPIPSDVAAS